jgi:tryptophanyl-tRNA synthetase
MSKSDSDPLASIFLDDSDAEIEKKFKKAVTDSGSTITASPEQAGVHNLLTIQSVLTGKTLDELVSAYAGRMYGHLKLDTAKIVTEAIRPIRDRAHELLAHPSYLNEVLREGAAKASQRAEQTLRHVKQKIGFTLP